ncbi:hypothetical protein ACTXY8_17435, partial [Pseudomonas aeruginosa]
FGRRLLRGGVGSVSTMVSTKNGGHHCGYSKLRSAVGAGRTLTYEKGAGGAFATSRERLEVATQRAQALAAQFNAYTEPEPFTALHELVALLTTLRD